MFRGLSAGESGMTLSLDDKVAFVTGGGRGIGRASARALGRTGASVAVCDLVGDAAQETADLIRADGGLCIAGQADVTDRQQLQMFLEATLTSFGHVDVVLANAGITQAFAPAGEISENAFGRVLEVNLGGVHNTFCVTIAELVKSRGTFISIASGAGLVGVKHVAAYVAAKHGVVGYTKTAALDYAAAGVRVNAVAPGTTETELIAGWDSETREQFLAGSPLGRLGLPEEIANVVAWLASDWASIITGAVIVADGGRTVG